MTAGADRRVRSHDVVRADEVVVVHQPAVLEIERVAAAPVAVRHQHALGAARGNHHVGGDRVRPVAHVGRGVGGEALHAARRARTCAARGCRRDCPGSTARRFPRAAAAPDGGRPRSTSARSSPRACAAPARRDRASRSSRRRGGRAPSGPRRKLVYGLCHATAFQPSCQMPRWPSISKYWLRELVAQRDVGAGHRPRRRSSPPSCAPRSAAARRRRSPPAPRFPPARGWSARYPSRGRTPSGWRRAP